MNLQARVEHSLPSSNHAMRVQIGDVCCSIACRDRDVFGYLKELYSNFLSDRPADIHVDLKIVERLSTAEIDRVMLQTISSRKGNRFTTSHVTLEYEFDPASHTLNMKVEKNLFSRDLEYKLMNHVLPSVYFTACGVDYGIKPPAMILHACGIVRYEQAIVFAAPSGTGKTTIARLCGNEYGRVINDEMVLVSWPDGGNHQLTVQGLPIVGGVSQRLNISAPLRCVLILKQSHRTTLRRLDQKEAYLYLIRQVVAPICLEQQEDTRTLLSLTSDFSNEVARNTAFYELEFTLDKGPLWEAVRELEKSLGKEAPVK